MKSILEPRFKYRPSYDTNIRETFDRIAREKQLEKEVREWEETEARDVARTLS